MHLLSLEIQRVRGAINKHSQAISFSQGALSLYMVLSPVLGSQFAGSVHGLGGLLLFPHLLHCLSSPLPCSHTYCFSLYSPSSPLLK